MLGGGYATPRRNWQMPKQRLSIGRIGTTSTPTPNVRVESLEPKVLKVKERRQPLSRDERLCCVNVKPRMVGTGTDEETMIQIKEKLVRVLLNSSLGEVEEEGDDVVHVEDRHHEDKKKGTDDAAGGGDVNVDLDAYRCEEDVSPVSVLSDELRVFSDDEGLDTTPKGPARSNVNKNDFDREIDDDLVRLVVPKVGESSMALNNKSMVMASPRQAPVICVIPDEVVKDLAT
jgi:hypothetical protein